MRGKQVVLQDLSRDSIAILFTPDLAAAIGPFVIDPGYSVDYDQRIGGVSDGTPSFLFATFSVVASLDAVP